MKKRSNDQQSAPTSEPAESKPNDLFSSIARQIAVLVVKQHRYMLAKERQPKRKKEG